MKRVFAMHKNKLCAGLLVAILFVWLIPHPALAAETTLTTTVPAYAAIRLEIAGEGSVRVNGVSYPKSTTIQIERHTKTHFLITPKPGHMLKAVSYQGDDVFSKLQDGRFTVKESATDSVLKVTFVAKSSFPQTGDTHPSVWLYGLLMAVSMAGLALTLKKQGRAG